MRKTRQLTCWGSTRLLNEIKTETPEQYSIKIIENILNKIPIKWFGRTRASFQAICVNINMKRFWKTINWNIWWTRWGLRRIKHLATKSEIDKDNNCLGERNMNHLSTQTTGVPFWANGSLVLVAHGIVSQSVEHWNDRWKSRYEKILILPPCPLGCPY